MRKIQVLIKDDDVYGFIMNKKLLISEGELINELEYMIMKDINYMLNKYKGLIKESELNEQKRSTERAEIPL